MKTLKEFKETLKENEFNKILKKFIPFCKKELKINKIPEIKFVTTEFARKKGSFGSYKEGVIRIDIHQRHPADVLRTLAHELAHFSQHQKNKKYINRGKVGSKSENDANVLAGIIMRKFDDKYPNLFNLSHLD